MYHQQAIFKGIKLPKKKNKKREESVQAAVSLYLKMNYPDVIFTAESSGLKVTMGQAVTMKNQRSRHTLPDVIILEPRGNYHGLILELKQEGFDLKLALASNAVRHDHVKSQMKTLSALTKKGYYADFACGFDEAKKKIDEYMTSEICV